MSDTANFLKFLLSEEIYVIDEQLEQAPTEKVVAAVTELETTPAASIKEENTKTESVPKPTSEILVLFSNPDTDNMKPDEIAFLQKILSAVKIDINKVDLTNVQKQTFNSALYKKVIAFTTQHDLSVNDKYQLSSGNQIVLCADDLSSIAASVDLKKKLWVELQKMFA